MKSSVNGSLVAVELTSVPATNGHEYATNGGAGDCADEDADNGGCVILEALAQAVPSLPTVMRLALNCPFENVRERCALILKSVQERGLPVPYPINRGPSSFIDPDEILSLGSQNDKTHALFVDAFAQNNRLDHVSQVMGYHPAYLEQFLKTQSFVLRGDGPLPYDHRHYLAIMAASRHRCAYLVQLQKQEFLNQNGDPTWLHGLSYAPKKLRDLNDLNKLLAHRPWLLNQTHVRRLTQNCCWSLAELVHAIVILAHFHSLCSFVFACGVNEEVDLKSDETLKETEESIQWRQLTQQSIQESVQETQRWIRQSQKSLKESQKWNGGSQRSRLTKNHVQEKSYEQSSHQSKLNMNGSPQESNKQESGQHSPPIEQEVGITTLVARMKTLSEQPEECSLAELTARFERVESQALELDAGCSNSPPESGDLGRFVEDPSYGYQDFARYKDAEDIQTFRVQDYSWDAHGYSLVNRLYNDVGYLLDDKFKTAYNLTYYTMGGRTDVDTSRFRRAIWNYVQCMWGVRHDDYDYGEVNQLLERSLKAFVKAGCCYPERVTKKDYDRVLREFKHSEKVHVNLMVMEARMQAELLYALRAVMRHMIGPNFTASID